MITQKGRWTGPLNAPVSRIGQATLDYKADQGKLEIPYLLGIPEGKIPQDSCSTSNFRSLSISAAKSAQKSASRLRHYRCDRPRRNAIIAKKGSFARSYPLSRQFGQRMGDSAPQDFPRPQAAAKYPQRE
jgi:hypothetical protein